MEGKFSLKDQLFNADKVAYLAGLFADQIDAPAFQARVMSQMLDLELKQRIDWIAACLAEFLSGDFNVAAGQIERALPPPLNPENSDDDFGDFIFAPLGAFVAGHGANDFDRSMQMLYQITQRFSMEWALRPFLKADVNRCLGHLRDWAGDDNYHVRRLVSEGTRPKLPWGMAAPVAQDARFDLLDRLYSDPTRYVTRSVANHLNDETKVDATGVVAKLAAWRSAGGQSATEMDWMTGHALRTLVKQGDRAALAMLGYVDNPPVQVVRLAATPSLPIGGTLEIEVEIAAQDDARLMVDYVLDLVKANGSTAPKVFKFKQLDLNAGQSVIISKRRKLLADATTYTLYPGVQAVSIQVNGQVMARVEFELL